MKNKYKNKETKKIEKWYYDDIATTDFLINIDQLITEIKKSSQLEPPVVGNSADTEDCYNNFWKDIVEKNGELNKEQLKKELFDYANILREVSIVYDTLTMGRISKPNTKAQVVIDEVNEVNREIEEDDSKISL